MPFRQSIKTGSLFYDNPHDKSSRLLGFGYSGNGPRGGANNPDAIKLHGVGPCPPGDYDIAGPYHKGQRIPGYAHPAPSDYTYTLTPRAGTDTFNRNGLLVHGDNGKGDQSASGGCCIQGREAREELDTLGIELGDTLFTVTIE